MKANRKAQAATLLVLGALGGVALWKQGHFAPTPSAMAADPQDAIYESLDAIRAGDLARFFNAHSGAMETSLRRAGQEVGETELLRSLQAKNSQVKGVAIQSPEHLSDREAKVRVEYVFADRNEIQIAYLEKMGERWKITRVDGAERIETLVPYGTEVK